MANVRILYSYIATYSYAIFCKLICFVLQYNIYTHILYIRKLCTTTYIIIMYVYLSITTARYLLLLIPSDHHLAIRTSKSPYPIAKITATYIYQIVQKLDEEKFTKL